MERTSINENHKENTLNTVDLLECNIGVVREELIKAAALADGFFTSVCQCEEDGTTMTNYILEGYARGFKDIICTALQFADEGLERKQQRSENLDC